MKKYIIPFFTLSIFCFTLVSCGSDAVDLNGSWKASSTQLETTALNGAFAKAVEAEYAQTIITLGPENTARLVRGDFSKEGVFTLEGNNLSLSNAEGDLAVWAEDFTIVNQSASEMTLTSKVDDKGSKATIVLQKQ